MDTLIGQRVLRTEDRRLLTGLGRFIDDRNLPGQAYAAFVRSSLPHARITGIQVARAREAPGVLAVLTGRDYVADGLGGIPHQPNNADHLDPTKPAFAPQAILHAPPPPQMPLAIDRVRHVGEAVALIIAASAQEAEDAAEL